MARLEYRLSLGGGKSKHIITKHGVVPHLDSLIKFRGYEKPLKVTSVLVDVETDTCEVLLTDEVVTEPTVPKTRLQRIGSYFSKLADILQGAQND